MVGVIFNKLQQQIGRQPTKEEYSLYVSLVVMPDHNRTRWNQKKKELENLIRENDIILRAGGVL